MPDLVWITGASSGIGRALAIRLADEGHRVVVSARSVHELEELADRSGGRIVSVPLDVTDARAVAAAVDRIETEAGPIGTAILNAGTHRPVKARDFRSDELARLLDLNLLGTARCLEAVMPRMIARRAGTIAVVASVAGYSGLPTAAYYGASKAALINMAESLKFDLDAAGVRLKLVNPGFVRTPLTDRNAFPMPFMIEAEEAAERIAKGLRGEGFEIAFPWRLVLRLKLLRLLPYALYFPLVARATGTGSATRRPIG